MSEQNESSQCTDSEAESIACFNGGSCVIVLVDGQHQPFCRFVVVAVG